MAIQIIKNLVPSSKYSIKCPYSMTPKFIVVHNTYNDASAVNEIAYMIRNDLTTSFHYAVDDIQAVQGIEENRNSWNAGDGTNGNGNRNGIAIEICYSKSGGDRFIKAEQNAVLLIVDILKRYGWGVDKIMKHQDFSGKYCLPIDVTQLLTPSGWKYLTELEVGDLVAQYENTNGQIQFAEIEDMVEPYEDQVVRIYKTEMTKDHNVLAKSNNIHTYNYSMKKWGDIISKNTHYTIPSSGQIGEQGMEISDNDLLLSIWVQADGHYMKRRGVLGDYYIGIEFHLSKSRKVDRIIELLEQGGYKYSHIVQTDGTSKIRLFGKGFVEKFESILKGKMFDWNFLKMNKKQFLLFKRELLLADGCMSANSYCSTKQKNYDVVQAIFSINGQRTNIIPTGSSSALVLTNSNLDFSIARQQEERRTLVSCVTVPSGAILIRQYGQPKIVGNCPHRTLDMGWNRFLAMVSDALAPKPAPIVYPFPEGTIVYPIEDVNLVKTAGYTDQTKYLLKKGTKSKVIKYHNVHGLYMALGNEAGEFYTSAWSREFTKFTTTPPVKSCEEICEEKVGQVASEYLLKLEEQQRASEGLKKDIENKDMGILQLQKTIEEKDKEIEHLKKEIETGMIQMGNVISDYEVKIEELEKVNLNLRKKHDMLNIGSVFTWEQIMKYVNSQEMKGILTALSSLFRGILDLLDRLRNKISR